MNNSHEFSAHRVMIVDDDEISRTGLALALQESFAVVSVESGEAALAQVVEFRPEVVLLDIGMPGLDGYETCQRLRTTLPLAEQPAVMFFSSLESLEDRLRAYDAGGDDFLTKPVAPEEVVHKVRAMVGLVTERKRIQAEKDSVQQMAMGFLTNLGETGCALNHLRHAPGCTSTTELARMTLTTLGEYGLDSALQFRLPWGEEAYDVNGPASPLEKSVFASVVTLDRIFQFSRRMVINYPHVSLLVKNLPVEDAERCGRLRDYLAIIAEGCEANLLALMRAAVIEERTKRLQETAMAVEKTIESLRGQYRTQQEETCFILHQLSEQFAHKLFVMGLTESQELYLQGLLGNAIDEALTLFQTGLDFDAQLGELLSVIAAREESM